MSTFKKTKVVMLSTNEKATVGSIVTRPSDNRMAIVNVLTKDDTQPCIHQHLYFLSDEEIKEGDWVYCLKEGFEPVLKQKVNPIGVNNDKMFKKIIATTDTSLRLTEIVKEDDSIEFPYITSLPQPTHSFIEKFVEEYNKGNQITEVLVEYENIDMDFDPAELNGIKWENKLKINPKDNTITIRKIKNNWSRKEVEALFKEWNSIVYKCYYVGKQDLESIIDKSDEWIEENL